MSENAAPRVELILKAENDDGKDAAKKKKRDSDKPQISVHEFLVDFLGALVPGILFTIAIAIALIPIISAIIAILSKTIKEPALGHAIYQFLVATKSTPSTIWIGLFIFEILVAYTLGHLFSRRNIKKPDSKSFTLVSNDFLKKRKRLREKPSSEDEVKDLLRRNFACDNHEDCEFPYPFLDKYLEERGHKHLIQLVTWRKGEYRKERSKTYINRLKIRLETYHPEACRPIIRNEAHVRLAASMWYVGRVLWQFCLGGMVLFILILLILWPSELFSDGENQMVWRFYWGIPFMIPAIVITAFAFYCQFAVQKFLLYQRLREVFYVLELAYTCFRNNPEMLNSPEVFGDDFR